MNGYREDLRNITFHAAMTTFKSITRDSQENYDSELSRFSRSLLTLAATFTILIMILGIFGNLLTIIALLKCPKVRNVAADFIISLCVSDCLYCVLVLPFMALRYIKGVWIAGDGILCTLVPFIQYGNVGVSLLCIAMITLNRYIMIAHHATYSKIYKKTFIKSMILFCWLFSYGFQLPTLFKIWGAFGYDPKLETCSIIKDSYGRSSKTALFIIAFIIPMTLIIICYARIFYVVHESEQRLRRHAESADNSNQRSIPVVQQTSSNNQTNLMQNSNNIQTASKITSNIHDQRDAKQKRNEWRITKMVLVIFLSFLVCYLPITITKVVDKDVNWPELHLVGYIMIYLSSCINPLIYVCMNKQYRKAYKTVLLCKAPRILSFTGGHSSGEKSKRLAFQFSKNSQSAMEQSQVTITEYFPNSCRGKTQEPHPLKYSAPDIPGDYSKN